MKRAALILLALLGSMSAIAAPASKKKSHSKVVIGDLDCNACHTTEGWKLTAGAGGGGGFDHDRTGFPLRAAHARTGCIDCHQPDRAISTTCASCHADPHQGRLGSGCDGCHTAAAWEDANVIERHRRTRLPLTGAHALTECSGCHVRQAERGFSDVPAECFACHEAEYRQTNIHPIHYGTPTTPALPRDCQQCHQTTAWSPAYIDESSVQAASVPIVHEAVFPLRAGPHRGAACEDCHAARSITCDGCHEHSPARLAMKHRGRAFTSEGAACLGCHPAGRAR